MKPDRPTLIGQRHTAQQGLALAEFSIALLAFVVLVFAVLEVGRMLWTYNAIADAVRFGARSATLLAPGSAAAVQNIVVYGVANPAQNARPVVSGLTAGHVTVAYTNDFGGNLGRVTVTVAGYNFGFLAIPHVLGASVTFPPYQVTLTGESAGFAP